ncbi:MAG TPA: BON domain-containing protein [Moraxellaceae bacterium]|nr:BON domain-containing protein [Moraxellaceae bacterium]
MSRILIAAGLALALSGCASLIADATGPEPIGSEQGKRTLSMRIEDSAIERTASINLYKSNPRFREANVNIISFYGSVLLAGQVSDEAMKAQAEKIVYDIAEVKRIHNELTVGPASYYLERSSDGFISTQIRAKLTVQEGFPSSRTKVFTVGGTVYLMGKLTPAEADMAVDYIKQVSGVKRIVKLVDYLPAPATPAAAPSTPAPAATPAP